MNPLPSPVVCLVTDRRRLAPGAALETSLMALERFLEQAIESGVDLIQVRERDLDARTLSRLVRRLVDRARGSGVRVVVNDRADVSLAVGADGVHLRADSPSAEHVRVLSPDWLIGRSVHQSDGNALDGNADYLLFGTVFSTTSKPGLPASGLAPLRAIAASSSAPVLAIGGMTPQHARECRRAGAAGIAAIGAFLPEGTAPGALGVATAVRAFREALAEASPREDSGLKA